MRWALSNQRAGTRRNPALGRIIPTSDYKRPHFQLIGKECKEVSVEAAADCIFGRTIS